MMVSPREQAAGLPARLVGRPEGLFAPRFASFPFGACRNTGVITRRVSPTFVLVTALLCLAVAGGMWAVASTARNRSTVLAEARTIAESEPVREHFAWQIADALVPHSAASNPADITRSNDIARKAVESDAFQQAFVAALPAIYDRVVEGATADVVLDRGLASSAVLSAGGTPPPDLTLQVRASDLPDLRRPLELMMRASVALAILGLLLLVVAVATTSHRGRAVMRVGRWMITVGLLTIVTFWLLPTLALLPLGGWVGVIGIILATGDWLALPAALLTAAGITIVVLGRAGEAETRRRNLANIPQQIGRSPSRPRIS
jgi:hypothetical protein